MQYGSDFNASQPVGAQKKYVSQYVDLEFHLFQFLYNRDHFGKNVTAHS